MANVTPVAVREAIVRAVDELGMTYEETAALLDVGEATVSRVLRRHRERGTVEPDPPGGGNYSPISGGVAQFLKQLVAKMPDATIEEFTAALIEATGVDTSCSGVQRALRRLGYSRKKRSS